MMETAGSGSLTPRAFLHVGAWSVARHQLSLAVAMGCQRIVCLARGFDAELASLQHAGEAAGAQFNVISGPRQLSPLVSVADEVLVIADGLMVTPQGAIELLSDTQGVVVQPIEVGLVAGFERIDINNATAGLMLIPGRLVERLNELPSDCDVASALTRIALQFGVAQRALPTHAREGGGWKLVRSEVEANELEAGWLATQLAAETATAPGTWIARLGVRTFGPALLHAGSGSNAVTVAAGGTYLLALIAGWFGFIVLGMCLAGAGWVISECAGQLARIERAALLRDAPLITRDGLVAAFADIVIVVLVLWTYPASLAAERQDIAFPPIVLLGLLRILPRSLALRRVGWLEDRLLLTVLLAFAAGAEILLPAMRFLAIGALAAGILLPRMPRILTRS
jgi:hypothetical protein